MFCGSKLLSGILPAIGIGLSGVLAVSCNEYPEMEGDNTAQLVSWTYYEPDTNYAQYRTFYVEDSMGVIEDDKQPTVIQNARSRLIRNKIIDCMENAGYVQTEEKDKADLYKIADALPKEMDGLAKKLHLDKQRLSDMPMLMMKIYVTRL